MEHECSAEQLDAEGEVAVARLVADSGDLPHALRHLADAIAYDPRLPDVHEALAEIIARAGGAEQLLQVLDEVEGQDFIGTIALRAHASAVAGQWDGAVATLFAVAGHEPSRSWLDVAWLRRPDLPDHVSPKAMAIAVGRLAQGLADPVPDDEREPLLPAWELLSASVARHGDHAMLLWCASLLARRLGEHDEAIAWAEKSYEIEPSHEAVVVKGYALRSAGRNDEAIALWEAEIERTPEDLGLCLDVAELLGSTNRPAEALKWTQHVLDREPDHPKAGAVALGLRYDLDEDVTRLIALADQVREQPGSFAEHVLAKLSNHRPWLGLVPEPEEAVINLLRQVLGKQDWQPDSLSTVTLSAVEPPSALLALRTAFPRPLSPSSRCLSLTSGSRPARRRMSCGDTTAPSRIPRCRHRPKRSRMRSGARPLFIGCRRSTPTTAR
ncbi:tetratricopeptide repeat protein [Kibdelosporangium philippinense]|uniref:Tetratricopeptide repeat protein n=1 Tax=Kibdelosporangium philippinense TaxID=211113 RepID=A0ABS8ZTE7_9PSEU|nr:tetratricopeptide repeat protein [Kibdelosporangium philippinense]MCE7011000.1 tetratricopeptide repeat protein [Kibdelosporangium philippinense]